MTSKDIPPGRRPDLRVKDISRAWDLAWQEDEAVSFQCDLPPARIRLTPAFLDRWHWTGSGPFQPYVTIFEPTRSANTHSAAAGAGLQLDQHVQDIGEAWDLAYREDPRQSFRRDVPSAAARLTHDWLCRWTWVGNWVGTSRGVRFEPGSIPGGTPDTATASRAWPDRWEPPAVSRSGAGGSVSTDMTPDLTADHDGAMADEPDTDTDGQPAHGRVTVTVEVDGVTKTFSATVTTDGDVRLAVRALLGGGGGPSGDACDWLWKLYLDREDRG